MPSHTWYAVFVTLCLLCWLVAIVTGSPGDHSWVFNKCLDGCEHRNCTSRKVLQKFVTEQPFLHRLFGWTCLEECKYICMWKTVDAYQRDGTKVPQFYGRWPFVRVLGIQEPASVIFSIMNGLTNLAMLLQIRRRVPARAPMYYTSQLSALVAINAWVWSTIFHTRDTPFTEAMDYICATGTITFTVLMLCSRILVFRPFWQFAAVASVILGCYAKHVHYLMFVHFDYGYNMKATVGVGMVNCLGWLLWCVIHRKRQPYVWKAAATIISLNLLLSLELGDFSPFLWTFDAHSLWHLGTVPLPFLWYSFAIDDSLFLLEEVDGRQKKAAEDGMEKATESKTDDKKEQ